MNKFLLVLVIILTTGRDCFGQVTDSALLFVKYSFSHKFDTAQMDKPYQTDFLLTVGKKLSSYYQYRFFENTRILPLDTVQSAPVIVETPTKFISVNTYSYITVNRYGAKLFEVTNLYAGKNYMAQRIQIPLRDYYTKYKKVDFHWKMSKDTLHIIGYICHKAMGTYGGRQYIAWYCPDLPFDYGPWKLNGLPGLILYAYDTMKEVQWKVKEVFEDPLNSYISDRTNMYVSLPEKEYYSQVIRFLKDPHRFLKAAFPNDPSLNRLDIDYDDGQHTYSPEKQTEEIRKWVAHPYYMINNPIELTR